jgi:hypothetical protein
MDGYTTAMIQFMEAAEYQTEESPSIEAPGWLRAIDLAKEIHDRRPRPGGRYREESAEQDAVRDERDALRDLLAKTENDGLLAAFNGADRGPIGEDEWDRLQPRIVRVILDGAPVWTARFAAGTGVVCTVSDAASVIARNFRAIAAAFSDEPTR